MNNLKNFLSEAERSALYGRQRILHDKRSCDRIRIILLLDKGWDYEEIATAFFFRPNNNKKVLYYLS